MGKGGGEGEGGGGVQGEGAGWFILLSSMTSLTIDLGHFLFGTELRQLYL